MSEYDDHGKQRSTETAPEARMYVAHWSPWIWIIPAIAVFFVGYLIVRYGFFGGGDITVSFADARGLDRYSPVRYRGAKVGSVQRITVDEKSHSVRVRIAMDKSMSYALRKGTRFWIIEPGLEGGGLGGLLGGTYIGIAPGDGDETGEFTGQEYTPVLTPAEEGRTVILEAGGLGTLTVGSPVQFQGIRVGRVLGAEYDAAHARTLIHAFIVQRFADQVRQSTRFWRAGGFNVSLGGGGLSMNGASLGSLIESPVAFYTPDVLPGPQVANGTHFELYESQAAALAAADGPNLAYVAYFPGAVQGLEPGTPVRMKGVAVGHVRDVRLRYVPQSASLETPVTIEIDPRLLEIAGATRDELRMKMNDALAHLVQKGMRATLQSSLVFGGASGVSLEMVGAPGTARLAANVDPPIIPASNNANGIDSALAAVNDVAARIRNLPIEEIAGHLRSTSQRLDTLVHDPALEESLHRLNESLANVEKVSATARDNVGPIVESLRNAAGSAEAAAARAQQLMNSAPQQNYDLGTLIKELTRAAQSVRGLASYLEENPDALLKGRGKAK